MSYNVIEMFSHVVDEQEAVATDINNYSVISKHFLLLLYTMFEIIDRPLSFFAQTAVIAILH